MSGFSGRWRPSRPRRRHGCRCRWRRRTSIAADSSSSRRCRPAVFCSAYGGQTAHTDERGHAVIADQSPGLFDLQVSDADRNRLWQSDVRVDAGDAYVPVHLDLHIVRGKVALGEAPLPAVVWFGTADGAVRARAVADDEGEFKVRLPRIGTWPVEVVCEKPPVRSIVNVDVTADEDLLIRLPDTSLQGWVVDRDGQRLQRGSVVLMASGRAFSSGLDQKGEFAFRGIPEGTV